MHMDMLFINVLLFIKAGFPEAAQQGAEARVRLLPGRPVCPGATPHEPRGREGAGRPGPRRPRETGGGRPGGGVSGRGPGGDAGGEAPGAALRPSRSLLP